MHICYIISVPFPPKEGIGSYVYGLSSKMLEKGHDVTVITRSIWNNTQKEIIDGINIIRAPFYPIYPFYIHIHGRYVNKIFNSIESEIDIVHIHSPLPPVIKTKIPMITSIHTPMLSDAKYIRLRSAYSLFSKVLTRLISYPLELKHIKYSNLVTAVSKSVAQELIEYGLTQDEIIIVGNGVDEEFFFPKQDKSEKNDKYIMYAGRIEQEKGLFDLFESGAIICKERTDINFILAGEGRHLNKLKEKSIEMKLEDRFIFLGNVSRNEMVKLYQKADIFVLPSYHEGLPTVLLEAMACALPVVATNVRGNWDIISNNENGILVPPKSPKELAEAILILLEDESMRKDLGKNARLTVENDYTWDIISNKMLKCYNSIIEA